MQGVFPALWMEFRAILADVKSPLNVSLMGIANFAVLKDTDFNGGVD
jgi:hypothetical protein